MSESGTDGPDVTSEAPEEVEAADLVPAPEVEADAPAPAAEVEVVEVVEVVEAVEPPPELPPEPPAEPAPDPVALPELEDQATFMRQVEEAVQAVPLREGELYTGTVLEISANSVKVDIGDGCVGDIDRDEFVGGDGSFDVEVGAELPVMLDSMDHRGVFLSKEKGDMLTAWDKVAGLLASRELVEGRITGRVQGGLTVDIGVKAFLPGSQVDLRPSRNLDKFIGQVLQFQVTKFDKKRGNIVLSRRAQLEKERESLREQTIDSLKVGAVMSGVVRNLTDYGCFVDLGGIDGLLHVTDMSWGRVTHPKKLVKVGDELQVQVLSFDPSSQRVSLGMKQLGVDPWEEVDRRFQVGQRVEGRVVNMTEFGAFIELEAGIEGLVHVSEMSWTRRIKHPKELLTRGQEVEAVILGIDMSARRVSLGLKQAQPNPWTVLQDRYPVGTRLRAKIRSVTNFGVFLGVEEGIDGLIHVSDLAWGGGVKDPRELFDKDQELEAVVLNIDPEAERLSLGVKQLTQDPWHDIENRYPIGKIVEGKVKRLLEFGAIVQLEEDIEALVHISEVAEERTEDIRAVLKEEDTVRAKVISLVPDQRKMGLSIKRLIESEHSADFGDFEAAQASTRTTIGDLIKEKIDIASLPKGPGSDAPDAPDAAEAADPEPPPNPEG